MPKISVIIPVYNVEKYLERCLESLINQTFKDWEAICINDGSTDNSSEILSKFKSLDNRFKIIDQPNQGLSIARNNGLNLIKGNYVYFLDSDDAICPQCLEICYNLINKYNAELICFDFIKNKNNSPIVSSNINYEQIKPLITDNPLEKLVIKNKYKIHFNVWTKLYKKEILKNIKFIEGINFEDYPYTVELLAQEPKTVIISEKLHFYTINTNSISHIKNNPKQIKDYFIGIEHLSKIFNNPKEKKHISFFKHRLIPNLLKQQLKRCIYANEDNRNEMMHEFRKELIYLNDNDLLSARGKNFIKYISYIRIIHKKGAYNA